MTNKETNKIQKHKDYVTCYQLHIDELKQRKKYFYDDLPIDKYEAGISYLINNHSIPEREATRLAMMSEAETDAQLERFEDMIKMLYSDFADAVNTPSITIEKKPEKTIDELVEEIRRRDRFDSERSHSPLKKADDAIKVDTSELTIDEQVDFMVNTVKTLTIGN